MSHTTQKKIAVIVNPISGGKDKRPVIELFQKQISKHIDYEFIYWEYPKQINEIGHKIRQGGFDGAIAMGGDGTINQVAKAVIDTSVALGIIPLGSGNGLARHLQIPLHIHKSIELINKWRITSIDSCTINDTIFFCTSGIGFDALIGKLFAESKTRGFYTYFKLTMANFINYPVQDYQLIIDDKKISTRAFLITFANASQYGNNAYIAPLADISDGMIDITILKPFKLRNMPLLARRMFNKTLHLSPLIEMHKARNITVIRNSEGPVHYDGEPIEMGKILQIAIKQASVKVIIP